MALIFPSFEVINNLKVKPTEGESHLLKFLYQNLDDNYEIYFQPQINGDNPDIVIVRKNSGVMIIEVKDWNLAHYHLDHKKNWVLNSNEIVLKSPLSQVMNYKNNLFELHIENLYKKFIIDKKMFAFVSLGVYFHNADSNEINNFLRKGFDRDNKYIKWLDYFELMGKDSLKKNKLDDMLKKKWLNKDSKFFDDELYDSFKRYLKPTIHTIEQGKQIEYNKEQLELIESKTGEQKIKGIAGSGKTMVLAKRAVNSYKRTIENVLILCYNIALRNYLHDKISEVKEEFKWNAFHINNYHQFITEQMNNYNILILVPDDIDKWEKFQKDEYFDNIYKNENLFESVKGEIKKYKSIFIDEAQDYPIEWLRIIKKYFLDIDSEYVLFADEKQNIYYNDLETDKADNNDRKPKTNIRGPWKESLKKTYRLSKRISEIANNFQKQFFNNKYYIDSIETQQSSFFDKETVRYHYFEKNIASGELCSKIFSEIKELGIHSNDVCILSFKIDTVVELDDKYRKNSKEKTITTVENLDLKNKLIENGLNEREIESQLEKVRKHKRFHFRMNPGKAKMSTIHSFKGWEINTLFLIIEKESIFQTAELIYTGLTRCRKNLIILNLGNRTYDQFFGKLNLND